MEPLSVFCTPSPGRVCEMDWVNSTMNRGHTQRNENGDGMALLHSLSPPPRYCTCDQLPSLCSYSMLSWPMLQQGWLMANLFPRKFNRTKTGNATILCAICPLFKTLPCQSVRDVKCPFRRSPRWTPLCLSPTPSDVSPALSLHFPGTHACEVSWLTIGVCTVHSSANASKQLC